MTERAPEAEEKVLDNPHLGENSSEGAAARVDQAMKSVVSRAADGVFDIDKLPDRLENDEAQALVEAAGLTLKELILKALEFNKEDSEDFQATVGVSFMAFRNSVWHGTTTKAMVEGVLEF